MCDQIFGLSMRTCSPAHLPALPWGSRGALLGMDGTRDTPQFPDPPLQAQSSSSSSQIQSQRIEELCVTPGPPQHALLGCLFLFFFFSIRKDPFGGHCSAVPAPEPLKTQQKRKTNPPNPYNGFCASKQLLSDTKPSDKQLSSPQLLPARLRGRNPQLR